MKNELEKYSGKGIKILLIDSGICESQAKKLGVAVFKDFVNGKTEIYDDNGHGTACASIIRRYAKDAELYSAKVLNENLKTDKEKIAEAYKWAINEVKPDIINLSIGTSDPDSGEYILKYIKEAESKNIITVAAENNEGGKSFPAVYDNVIGVSGNDLPEDELFLSKRVRGLNIFTTLNFTNVLWKNNSVKNISGNSYSAAKFTGLAALLAEQHKIININQLLKFLDKLKIETGADKKTEKRKYALHNCSINIDSDETYHNVDIFDQQFQNEEFDALLIDLKEVTGEVVNKLERFVDRQKEPVKIFLNDPVLAQNINDKNIEVIKCKAPITESDYRFLLKNKKTLSEIKIKTPQLHIQCNAGHLNSIVLHYKISEMFLSAGYKCANISNSLFTQFFNSFFQIFSGDLFRKNSPLEKLFNYLRIELFRIDKTNPDLILSSFKAPALNGEHIEGISYLDNFAFLTAIETDYLIYFIDKEENLNKVKKEIETLEQYSDKKVICIVTVNPELKNYYQNNNSLRVFDINDKNIEKELIEFFINRYQ